MRIKVEHDIDFYAIIAKALCNRSLLRDLRDARKRLAHNGRRSFAGKEAKKEIAALEAEIRRRGLEVSA